MYPAGHRRGISGAAGGTPGDTGRRRLYYPKNTLKSCIQRNFLMISQSLRKKTGHWEV